MSILMATKIVAPNIWGWLTDRGFNRLLLVRSAGLLSWLVFVFIYFADAFWPIALVMIVFSFFWNASLPQFEVVTLNALGERAEYYTRIRVWGSFGFILAASGLGLAVDRFGTGLLPTVVLLLMLGIWASTMLLPAMPDHQPHDDAIPLKHKLREPQVLALLIVCFLIQASHGPYYSLYTLYMNTYGYSDSLIGALWALGVGMEVVVFLIMVYLVPRFGLRTIFLTSILLGAVRWMLIGSFAQWLWVQMIAQMLHAASFGSYHAVAIQLFHRFFTGRLQGRGQALYSSLSFGAGGALGALLSGWIWTLVAPEVMFWMASVWCLMAFVIAKKFILTPEIQS